MTKQGGAIGIPGAETTARLKFRRPEQRCFCFVLKRKSEGRNFFLLRFFLIFHMVRRTRPILF
jgi:hypothetical protein